MNLKNSVINFKSKIVNSIFVLTMFLFASGQMMAQTIINTSHFKAYDDAGVTANTTFGRLNNVETSLILAFQLPAISAEESILDARLQLEITTGSQATSFRALDIDVLPNKTTTISSADMGTGANAQTHFIDGHGVSISEDISLAISQQIASGNVVEGDYIVLELKLGDYAPADKYVKIYATGTPTLTLTVGTPPDPTAPVIETIDDATVFTGYGKKIMVTASDVNKEECIYTDHLIDDQRDQCHIQRIRVFLSCDDQQEFHQAIFYRIGSIHLFGINAAYLCDLYCLQRIFDCNIEK